MIASLLALANSEAIVIIYSLLKQNIKSSNGDGYKNVQV